MNKLSRPEIIVTLSLLPAVFMVFVEHDELFILFLIELGFLCIIGLMMVYIYLFFQALIFLMRWMRDNCRLHRADYKHDRL